MSVYFIQAKDGGPIKIGYATDAVARLRALQTSHHRRLVLRRVIKSGTVETERELHARFAEYRLVGEWFRAEPEVAIYGKCKADKSDRERLDNLDEWRRRGQDELADELIRFLRADGTLKLSELLRLATMLNYGLLELTPDMQEPIVRVRLAFLEHYGAPNDPRVEECQRELRHIERKRT